jgi:hypothetical protein
MSETTTNANGENLLLGRGKVYFNRLRSDGSYIGETFLGNCTTLEGTTSDETREKYSSAEAASPLLKRANIRRTMELSLTLDEFSKFNLALATMGDNSFYTQNNTAVTAEAHNNVTQGTWVKLTYRSVSTVVVKNDAGSPTTYTVTTDYVVDAATGRIYIVPGGAIADATNLRIDYAKATITTANPTVRAGVSGKIEGSLRFIGDPAEGPTWELEAWSVTLNPDGAIGFISDDFAEFTLKATVQADSVNHPTEPLYRLIYLAA